MTQFALIKSKVKNDFLKPFDEINDPFLLDYVDKILPNVKSNKIFVINQNGKNIDYLFSNAQKSIFNSIKFERTELYRVVRQLSMIVDEMFFLYGSDYKNLECVYSSSSLLDILNQSIMDSFCECYIHYKNPLKNPVLGN